MIGTFDWVIMVLLGAGSAEVFLWLAAKRIDEEEKGFATFLAMNVFCLIGGAIVAALFAALMEESDRLAPSASASLGALVIATIIVLVLALNWRLWQRGLARPRPPKED